MTSDICTKRLLLRPIALDDVASLHKIRSIPDVATQFSTGAWADEAAAEEWIRTMIDQPASLMYTIRLLPTSSTTNPPAQIIGLMGLNRWGMLHYMIDPTLWNNGYATEALHAFKAALFDAQPERTVIETIVAGGNCGKD
ncbi:hypothetical protein BT63DRAFT_413977 [Microthyrium microscopicum]|uniref:N-acetyltransferase domain-containing protein n=1 Tax=Microthyrium microscopicum TaxID=703497 RepID=A0A6A6UCH1_9PEZI|nr:hypothetical protein BT63DRAFT_413977 [Microthyrium microscopicum]